MSGRILAGFLVVLLMMVAGAAEPTRVVQAEEILKKIELGQPVEYDNVTVVGDLDLRGLHLSRVPVKRAWFDKNILLLPDYDTVVFSSIKITNSIIEGSANLNGTLFQNTVIFHGTMFNGPVYLVASRFKGAANFSYSQFSQTANFWYGWFNQAAYFRSAQFNQTCTFKIVQFNGTAEFSNVKFKNSSEFYTVQFNETAEFSYSQFNNTAQFSYSQFNQTANFYNAQFNHIAYFNGAQFKQNTTFANTQFNQDAIFQIAQFNQAAYFNETQFNKLANFIGVMFNQTAMFWNAKFNQTAHFWDAKFNQTADFEGAQFNQLAIFDYVVFNQNAYFYKAQFNQAAIFSNSKFDQGAIISHAKFNQMVDFREASFLFVSLDYSQFSKEAFFDGAKINGTISLYRTKYDTLNIRWSSIHDLAYDDTAYHLLIQNFNRLGFTDDASECQYSYRCKHREELLRQHKFDRWLFDLLAWATYGYGLRPVRPLGWAALFILMGGLFFFLTGSVAKSKDCPNPTEVRPSAAGTNEKKPDGNVCISEALLLSATYFTSGASSIISATPAEFVPVGRGRYVVVLLRLLGWIFFVIFLSSLTRTV